jgi:hypothetical protein
MLLNPLHRLSFAAFLSEHRFLTPDFAVEEARYTNGAYILINQSETDSYETEQVTLPPLGFYVRHPQMVAHDALRVGEEQFSTRAYRITRSQDSKPLTRECKCVAAGVFSVMRHPSPPPPRRLSPLPRKEREC